MGDLLIVDGRISDRTGRPDSSVPVIDAQGLIVAPGLIDMHVHLREPGGSQKETIASGTRAAAAGGFTSILAMPNTNPPADGPNTIALMRQRAEETACINVFTTGCITVGMKGEQLAPIGSLKKAGVVAITDDGHCVQNNELMRRALDYARMFDLLTLDHCQDYQLSAGGVVHEGYWSTVLGLPGWPRIAEDVIVARDILLSELTGARVHVQHLSSAGSVRLVREAKLRGVKVFAEAMPHHIALTDASIEGFDTNFKMNRPCAKSPTRTRSSPVSPTTRSRSSPATTRPTPPMRRKSNSPTRPSASSASRPSSASSRRFSSRAASSTGRKCWGNSPSIPPRLLKLDRGTLAPGAIGDVALIDPKHAWKVDAEKFHSLSRNTPFNGWQLPARAPTPSSKATSRGV